MRASLRLLFADVILMAAQRPEDLLLRPEGTNRSSARYARIRMTLSSSFSRAMLGLVLASACSLHRSNTGPRLDRNLLLPEQFGNRGYTTAYQVIEAMRSNWLTERGPDSFSSPAKVQVYFDGVRVGGVESLRTIDLRPVTYIRFFDGIAATARWGLDHGMGAIYVSTHPLSEMIGPGNPPPTRQFGGTAGGE